MKKKHSVPALEKKKRQKKDFSEGVVVTMLLVLVIVSIISIAFYLHALNTIRPKFVVNEGRAVGEVSITITKAPPEGGSESEFTARPKENNLNTKP